MATIRIPSTMRTLTRNQADVVVPGTTVREVLANLDASYPGIGAKLLDERGAVRRYVNVFLNEDDIRALRELDTPVKDADRLTLIPAMAGG
ncbi:MoaD/ThiS family protein [Myxococcus sp. MISCRS1]|jgi:molybdopterin converting factor small subunit|uniref:MoaD/ThiS family protein n=1 Tax=Myxococcus TaxID=32 RepID=UPI001CBE30A5|nr:MULTISPECIES: MoaD/ThiS family protein [unclassified Myxococcus]MBZ4399565.1 MoaD/ThiS family protein [Myxococcus sp. AS-1-15]MBZ4412154.1 MoaD/ThiS family protein [Myxococcus sp. XM-1-1-1]MCY0995658.1 MoaD/ThiS family protein [Myxococcus sp. MISCRS1]BDT34356.1 MoaD/ThiS family protein [Myxococcus sp. MH1]